MACDPFRTHRVCNASDPRDRHPPRLSGGDGDEYPVYSPQGKLFARCGKNAARFHMDSGVGNRAGPETPELPDRPKFDQIPHDYLPDRVTGDAHPVGLGDANASYGGFVPMQLAVKLEAVLPPLRAPP